MSCVLQGWAAYEHMVDGLRLIEAAFLAGVVMVRFYGPAEVSELLAVTCAQL